MIVIKEQFNNGYVDCFKIFSNKGFKLKNKVKDHLFNATKDFPLSIAQKDYFNYVESDVEVEEINDEE